MDCAPITTATAVKQLNGMDEIISYHYQLHEINGRYSYDSSANTNDDDDDGDDFAFSDSSIR